VGGGVPTQWVGGGWVVRGGSSAGGGHSVGGGGGGWGGSLFATAKQKPSLQQSGTWGGGVGIRVGTGELGVAPNRGAVFVPGRGKPHKVCCVGGNMGYSCWGVGGWWVTVRGRLFCAWGGGRDTWGFWGGWGGGGVLVGGGVSGVLVVGCEFPGVGHHSKMRKATRAAPVDARHEGTAPPHPTRQWGGRGPTTTPSSMWGGCHNQWVPGVGGGWAGGAWGMVGWFENLGGLREGWAKQVGGGGVGWWNFAAGVPPNSPKNKPAFWGEGGGGWFGGVVVRQSKTLGVWVGGWGPPTPPPQPSVFWVVLGFGGGG